MKLGTKLLAATAMMIAGSVTLAQAENLRILTWGSYAPEELVKKFEAENPDIKVEVTFSNNEEMIAKLRATGGTGLGLAITKHVAMRHNAELTINSRLGAGSLFTLAFPPSRLVVPSSQ